MIVSFTQSKGGNSKTSSVWDFAYNLKEKGNKVLVVDMDSQANLSIIAGANMKRGTYDLLMEEAPAKDLIQPFRYGDIISANDDLSTFDFEIAGQRTPLYRLKKGLEPVKDQYDYILIDCPPALGFLTMNALVAADTVLIPTLADKLALYGIGNLHKTLDLIKDHNPDLDVSGILITRYDGRPNINREIRNQAEQIAQAFGTKVFETPVRETSAVREAQDKGLAVQEYKPRATAARDYAKAIEEFLKGENTNG